VVAWAALLGAGAATVTDPAAGLRIEAWPPVPAGTASTGRWTIFLDGYIDSQASRRLGSLIAQRRIGVAAVYLNSPGGSLLEGMAIGRLLRERGYETRVGARASDTGEAGRGVCYSACPFAFAGGVRRRVDPGSELGVHRVENRVPWPDGAAFDKRVAGEATAYLASMGVSDELFLLMEQVPQEQIRVLTVGEAEELRLVNDEAGAP
jgi:hypothetical protein